ncbi:MAG TPA: hypothetical protein DIT13_04750 [Verrucomicrobiales bacterium]|nr:hypothetical protein [Verrucomicrobiales bacterium]HRJ09367.1 hypothetical protein [Prosthecobacter sp.]HRK15049.1 hypothetical protein [Prosthecobacter sp.]
MKHLLSAALLALALLLPTAALCADVSVTAGNVRTSDYAVIAPGVAGETITAGQVLFLSSADDRYYLADVNAAGETLIAGIAVSGAAAGQRLLVCIEDPDFTPGFTLSTSAPVYVASATAGGIAPVADVTTGWYCTVIMVAKSTTKAAFRARGLASGSAATAP